MRLNSELTKMRLAIALYATVGILSSAFQPIVAENGFVFGITVILIASACGAFFGPFFRNLWAGGLIGTLAAAVLTMVISAGTTLVLVLVLSVLFLGDPSSTLMNAGMVFASGAIIAPMAMSSNLVSATIFLVGAYLIGRIARQVVKAEQSEAAAMAASKAAPRRRPPKLEFPKHTDR